MHGWYAWTDGRTGGWGWLGGGLPETVTHYGNLYRVSAYTGVLSAYHEGLTLVRRQRRTAGGRLRLNPLWNFVP